jgi:hypothetical protein
MAKKAEDERKPSGYVALTGIDYRGRDGKPKRVEAGERCDDVPSTALPWLLSQGHVKKAED